MPSEIAWCAATPYFPSASFLRTTSTSARLSYTCRQACILYLSREINLTPHSSHVVDPAEDVAVARDGTRPGGAETSSHFSYQEQPQRGASGKPKRAGGRGGAPGDRANHEFLRSSSRPVAGHWRPCTGRRGRGGSPTCWRTIATGAYGCQW